MCHPPFLQVKPVNSPPGRDRHQPDRSLSLLQASGEDLRPVFGLGSRMANSEPDSGNEFFKAFRLLWVERNIDEVTGKDLNCPPSSAKLLTYDFTPNNNYKQNGWLSGWTQPVKGRPAASSRDRSRSHYQAWWPQRLVARHAALQQ